MPKHQNIDFDIHGLIGLRLIDAAAADVQAVASQVGPMQKPIYREPDICIRFVPNLNTPELKYLGLDDAGFNKDGFYILKSKNFSCKTKIPFERIGRSIQIICESGIKAVPLLIAIINLTLLAKNCLALHASAFIYNDKGVLVTGWSKGGKTESLLAFANHGARYIGDEWILLSQDGKMYGLPEPICIWDWHMDYLPQVRKKLSFQQQFIFKTIHTLSHLEKAAKGKIRKMLPLKLLAQAMPALKRQLHVNVPPEAIFGANAGKTVARPDKVFFIITHEDRDIIIKPIDPTEIVQRMIACICYEMAPFMGYYHAFCFAFPNKSNPFIENAHVMQLHLLKNALDGKESYLVQRPYPVSFENLFDKMKYFLEQNQEKESTKPARMEKNDLVIAV
jgi:hypothetical protein